MSVQRIYLANLLTSGSNASIKVRPEFLKGGNVFSLETFYKANKVAKVLGEFPDVKILLDSGAHTLIHEAIKLGVEKSLKGKGEDDSITFGRDFFDSLPAEVQHQVSEAVSKSTEFGGFLRGSTSRFVVDWTYFDKKEAKDFLERYIQYVHEHGKQLYDYVNLDVIFNPERTWDHQKYMESCGCHPIPVFHFGEDLKWLKKYMDEHEYIGIGGLGQDITKAKFIIHHGDPAFKLITDSGQKIRTHGFAVTSLDLMLRYDWYSCDSTTWVKHAAYGAILVPRFDNEGLPEYEKNPLLISTSEQSKYGTPNRPHYTRVHPEEVVKRIREYFERKGWKDEDLGNVWEARVDANITYFSDLALFIRNHKRRKLTTQKRFF
jgi:hypothetical protein